MEAEKVRIEDEIRYFEKLYDQEYGWLKEITNIKDGLNKVEREIIRALLKNGGSISAGILVGEVISKLVYIDINEIKSEIIRMLNQNYPLIKRELLLGKPYFTIEKVELTELGKTFIYNKDEHYLNSKLPLYLIQEQIQNWDSVKISRLSLIDTEFYSFIKDVLINKDIETSAKRYLTTFKVASSTKIEGIKNITEQLLTEGKINLKLKGSFKFNKFNNELTLYSLPIDKTIYDLLRYCNSNNIEVSNISDLKNNETEFKLKLKNITSKNDVIDILNSIGMDQEIQHSYYILDDDGEFCLASITYLIEYWLSKINNKTELLDLVNDLLKNSVTSKTSNSNCNSWKQVWDMNDEKWVIVKEDGLIQLKNEYDNALYQFKIKDEHVVIVTDNHHIRVEPELIEETLERIRNNKEHIRVLGSFPMSDKVNKNRVFYFINQKGYVKSSKESDLFTRVTKVNATSIDSNENIVKILCNDDGKEMGYIVFVTKKGYVKVLHVSELKPKNKASKYVLALRLSEDDEVYKAFLIKDNFKEIHLRLKGNGNVVEKNFKDWEIVTSKLNRGKLIKGFSTIDEVEILNNEIISDKVII